MKDNIYSIIAFAIMQLLGSHKVIGPCIAAMSSEEVTDLHFDIKKKVKTEIEK